MESNSTFPLDDQKGKNITSAEIINVEKQLWALILSKGLLHADVGDLYRKACSSYEKIILNDLELLELQNVEFSLWKLHYKHIDEFRKRIRQSSANLESSKVAMPLKVSNVQNNNDKHIIRFKSFLSEATEFYQDLIIKIRRCYGLPEEPLFYKKADISSSVELIKMNKYRFLCHRFLVCLGDLARYRELYEKTDIEKHNWAVAATYYSKATFIWPDSGNPQNQLAVLATYIGDEFLALYHCIRSLAVKEPFPDAWNNLMLLFEKNRSSSLHSLSSKAHFDFLNPSEKCVVQNELQLSDGFPNCNTSKASEHLFSFKTDLWSLFIRMISFFIIKSSLEDFHCTFAATMRELEAMLELNDMKLKTALETCQHMDSARTGPFKALQIVAILIFIIQNLTKSEELKGSKAEDNILQPVLTQLALTSAFVCMGRLVDRCLKYSSTDSCLLLPAVLVFVEWLVGMLDKVEQYGADEKSVSAMSYFFSVFVNLLNWFSDNRGEVNFPDCTTLWEDFELQGFVPIADAHVSLDFSTHSENMNNFENGKEYRASRIIRAAMKIVNRTNCSHKWIIYDKLGRKFCTDELKEFQDQRVSEIMESSSDLDVKECEEQIHEGKQSTPFMHSNSVDTEEEEVILFKPMTRYNSAPLSLSAKNKFPLECLEEQPELPDECLRRASSFAQNQARSNPLSFHSGITNFSFNKAFKQQEPPLKESASQQFSETSISAGPPSLNAWVLNKGNLSIVRDKRASDDGKHRLLPVEEKTPPSLTDLSISETEDSVIDYGLVSSINHSSSPYSAPAPSAPLIPEGSDWFRDGAVDETDNFIGASQVSGYSNWTATHEPHSFGSRIPGFMDRHSPLHEMLSSSEWLRRYKENQNLERANSHTWPLHIYAPDNSGNLYGHDASRFDFSDRWAMPVTSSSVTYLENPPPHLGLHLPYGMNEERGETVFHNYQRPSPCGCNEEPPLLQHLKEREWWLQRNLQVRGPTYMGDTGIP